MGGPGHPRMAWVRDWPRTDFIPRCLPSGPNPRNLAKYVFWKILVRTAVEKVEAYDIATGEGLNVSHWEVRHPPEARHDPCSRQRYVFSKYLTPSAAYRVTNTIKKKRRVMIIDLWALCQLFYHYLGGDN